MGPDEPAGPLLRHPACRLPAAGPLAPLPPRRAAGAHQGHDGRRPGPQSPGADRRLPPLPGADHPRRLPQGRRLLPGALCRRQEVAPGPGGEPGRRAAPAGPAGVPLPLPHPLGLPGSGHPHPAPAPRAAPLRLPLLLRPAGPAQLRHGDRLPAAGLPAVHRRRRQDHPPQQGGAHPAAGLQQAQGRPAGPRRQRGPRPGEGPGLPRRPGGAAGRAARAPWAAPGGAGRGRRGPQPRRAGAPRGDGDLGRSAQSGLPPPRLAAPVRGHGPLHRRPHPGDGRPRGAQRALARRGAAEPLRLRGAQEHRGSLRGHQPRHRLAAVAGQVQPARLQRGGPGPHRLGQDLHGRAAGPTASGCSGCRRCSSTPRATSAR